MIQRADMGCFSVCTETYQIKIISIKVRYVLEYFPTEGQSANINDMYTLIVHVIIVLLM